MEIKMLMLAIGKLSDEVDTLKLKVADLSDELVKVKEAKQYIPVESPPVQIDITKDILIDTKEVMNILGICYNSLCKLVKQGHIKRVRINQRRMKYSKNSIESFIQNNS